MTDVPKDRKEAAAPFTYFAVDNFGPFYIRIKRSDVPRYVVLCTCLTSRAIYLEVTESLEIYAFINALRRLSAIRGPIHLLRSDRGTNFVEFQEANIYLRKRCQGVRYLLNVFWSLESQNIYSCCKREASRTIQREM